MSEIIESSPSAGARFGIAFRNVLRVFLRLIVIVTVIGGIGAAIYYGMPVLYERYILPIENNTARIDQMESYQAQEIARLNELVTSLQTRLTEVESGQTVNTQGVTELLGRVDGLEETIVQLEKIQTALANLEQTSSGNSSAISALQEQVEITRVLQLLTRSRQSLAQSNFGLARSDVLAAHSLLADLQTGAAEYAGVISRLNLALGNLPNFPVVAAADVEIAWEMLMGKISPDAASTLETTIATPEAPVTPVNP